MSKEFGQIDDRESYEKWFAERLKSARPEFRRRANGQLGPAAIEGWDASDAVQDAYAKAWKKRHSLRERTRGGLRSWLSQILRFTIFSRFRQLQTRRMMASREEAETETASPGETPSAQLMQQIQNGEDANVVAQFMESLKPQQRLYVKYRYELGMKHEAIAKQMGVSPSRITQLKMAVDAMILEFRRAMGESS